MQQCYSVSALTSTLYMLCCDAFVSTQVLISICIAQDPHFAIAPVERLSKYS
jgi:hypothetical protein